MAFKSFKSFSVFTQKVRHGHRYVYDEDVKEFLSEVERTSIDRIKTIHKGSLLYRAQLGNDWCPEVQNGEVIAEVQCPYEESRMFPLTNEASEGRVNPKGIPYLYMATEYKTAMSEVRPGIGSNVSLAILATTIDLKVIDCSLNHAFKGIFVNFGGEEPSDDKKEKVVWTEIDRAFSIPVVPSDTTADYVPTQIISEMFKSKGFDGILYKSMLGDAFNVVTFNTESVELRSCSLYTTESAKFDFNECARPYFKSKQ